MKRFSALFFLLLLCSQTVFALQHYVGQFYDGEAKPRAEVAWIWVGNSHGIAGETNFDGIDGSKISTSHYYVFWKVIEVLPGKHLVAVSYESVAGRSVSDQQVEIDAKAGENYFIRGETETHWRSSDKWEASVTAFTPAASEIEKLKREKLERSVSVDGVVQSWAHGNLVLSITPGNQSRKFKVIYDLRLGQIMKPTGTKVRVFYFPSRPEETASVEVVE